MHCIIEKECCMTVYKCIISLHIYFAEHAAGTYPYIKFFLMCIYRQGYWPCQTENAHPVRKKFCHYWGTQVKSFREFKKCITQNFIWWFCLSYRIKLYNNFTCTWHLFPVISKLPLCINYTNWSTIHAKHSWRTNKVLSTLWLLCWKNHQKIAFHSAAWKWRFHLK